MHSKYEWTADVTIRSRFLTYLLQHALWYNRCSISKAPDIVNLLVSNRASQVGQLRLDPICYFVHSATDITPLYIPVSMTGLDSVSVAVV